MCINSTVFPYISNDIREVEKKGDELISESYFADPNNQLAEILYLADNGSKRKYMQALKKQKNIAAYFPHKSEVDKYFFEVFTEG